MFHSPRLPQALTCSLFGLFASVANAALPTPAPESLQPLLNTINERLNVANLVALTKWDTGKPIQDTARETLLITLARKQAVANNVDPDEAAELTAAQIEANKLVQYTHLSDWQFQGKAPDDPRPDLVKQIRPQLDELQKRLLQQLADFTPQRTDPQCPQWLAAAVHEPLNDPLRQLAMIRATAELCIYKG